MSALQVCISEFSASSQRQAPMLFLPRPVGWRADCNFKSYVLSKKQSAFASWFSGAMVSRCTCALSGELAVEEFQRTWV